MAASHSDSYQLSQSPVFQNRVQAALLAACINVSTEGWGVAFHRERSTFVNSILSNTTSFGANVTLFSNSSATDATVLADATQNGTVVLTTGNRDTQAALVTDAHIDNAISSQFNAFVREPGI